MSYPCTSLFLNLCALIIFNQNDVHSLLQWSPSLMTCLLVRGRDNLSLTRPQLQPSNNPINQSKLIKVPS